MDSANITLLLNRVAEGDSAAKEELFRALYAQLGRVARNQLSRAGTLSLDAPAILHETYLRLEGRGGLSGFPNRRAFFSYASTVMRTVIVDYVRERLAEKRGGELARVTLQTGFAEVGLDEEILELNDAMTALERVDPRCHLVVQLRYFGGLTEAEVASLLEMSTATVGREWYKARAFLFERMQSGK